MESVTALKPCNDGKTDSSIFNNYVGDDVAVFGVNFPRALIEPQTVVKVFTQIQMHFSPRISKYFYSCRHSSGNAVEQ